MRAFLLLSVLFLATACEQNPFDSEKKPATAAATGTCNALVPGNATTLETALCNMGMKPEAPQFFAVGMIYLEGIEGTRRQCDKAEYYLTAAAKKQDLLANLTLGQMFSRGVKLPGLVTPAFCQQRDYVKAMAHLRAAKALADKTPAEKPDPRVGSLPNLALAIEAVGSKMSTAAKAESDKLYREIMPKPAEKE